MLKAYYQITKPGIIYGNLITAIAGYLLASDLKINGKSFSGLVIGLGLVIAAACTFNNLADRSIDRKMTRTKNRPSVSGKISLKTGLVYGSILLFVGIILLGLMTNILTLLIGLLGFVVYVSAYTYSKRKTSLATLIGSVSGAMPIVGGYTAFSGRIDSVSITIGMMMLVWQMPHFYAIALFREKDYQKASIPVLPLTAGHRSTGYWMVFYSLLFAMFSISLYWLGPVGLPYLIIMGLVSLLWLGYNFKGLFDTSITSWAKKDFRYSLIVLIIMSLMLALR